FRPLAQRSRTGARSSNGQSGYRRGGARGGLGCSNSCRGGGAPLPGGLGGFAWRGQGGLFSGVVLPPPPPARDVGRSGPARPRLATSPLGGNQDRATAAEGIQYKPAAA